MHVSGKHQHKYVALKVTYVILCGMLKITYPSAACHLTCQTEVIQVGLIRKQELAEEDSGSFAV